MKNICCIIGPPGSGKGTNSIKFVEKNPFILRFSIGEELRKLPGGYTSTHLAAKSSVKDIIEKKLSEEYKGYIIDGYPRSLDQLDILINGRHKLFFLNIMVNDQGLLIERLSNRNSCDNCGRTFANSDKCINCKISISQRDDDADKQKVMERLNLYYTTTKEIEEFLEKKGLSIVHVEGQTDSTYHEIDKALSLFFNH